MINHKDSYTSANSLPIKVMKDKELLSSIFDHNIIIPIHVQIIPTNKCNLNCSFCSCSDRMKKEKLTLVQLKEIVDITKKLGTKSFTVTGGGEPLLHENINEFLIYAHENDIKLGLVSNGISSNLLSQKALDTITWARISFSDDRKFDNKFIDSMNYLRQSKIDLAFSYVLTDMVNLENIKNIVDYANANNFTHIRMVDDILSDSNSNINNVKNWLGKIGIDTSKIIFQGRKQYSLGDAKCSISLLKPLIAADGNVYACCGLQYSRTDIVKDYAKNLSMGNYKDLEHIINNQEYFDGSKCSKCFYQEYNVLLNGLKSDLVHQEFL